MDFLDPAKRRRHSRQLVVGYVLVAILILLIVRFFVIWASGETINPRTGKINDYGLLFVDSKPGGADIYLNNQKLGNTASRLNLSAGAYDIRLSRSGYYDWTNKLNLAGQSVDRVVYPFLFPKEPKPVSLKTYKTLPSEFSFSHDHHWLLVGQSATPGSFSFDLYDTTKPTAQPSILTVPLALLTNTGLPEQSLNVVEWASDNNHMLLKHSFAGGAEFIIFSRTDTAGNLNLNQKFTFAASAAGLNGGRANQIYLYRAADQVLDLANTDRSSLAPVLTKVLDWKAVDNDLIFYDTADGAAAGKLSFKIWDNAKTYKLTELPQADLQTFDAHSYQSHWYYVVGNSVLNRAIIYRDPLDSLKNSSQASPLLSFVTSGSIKLSFSENGRFIDAQSGQLFNLYDTETQSHYKYTFGLVASPELEWMDGHRLIGDVQGSIFVMDFDSQNQHKLLPTAAGSVAFDSPYNHMYSFSEIAADGSSSLQITDLRAGSDLPK